MLYRKLFCFEKQTGERLQRSGQPKNLGVKFPADEQLFAILKQKSTVVVRQYFKIVTFYAKAGNR